MQLIEIIFYAILLGMPITLIVVQNKIDKQRKVSSTNS